jgi:recombination protein RecT
MSNIAVIEEVVYALRPAFDAVSVDKSITFQREAEFALQAFSKSDYLTKVAAENIQSVKDCITNLSAIGLTLNPVKKQCYLVPRKKTVCLDISYMGLIDMAVDSKSIKWAQAAVVRKGDSFQLHGYDKPPTHSFDPFGTDRGDIVGVFVVVKLADCSDYLTHTMSIADVYAIRDRGEAWKAYIADTSKRCPWVTDEVEMIRKTCVKQASKYWPKNDKLDTAIAYLNGDGGEGIDFTPDTPPTVAQKPAVATPVAKATSAPAADISDAVVKTPAKQAAPAATTPNAASAGEVAYITKKIAAKGLSIAQAREMAGLDVGDSLAGLTKDGFVALKDVLL